MNGDPHEMKRMERMKDSLGITIMLEKFTGECVRQCWILPVGISNINWLQTEGVKQHWTLKKPTKLDFGVNGYKINNETWSKQMSANYTSSYA